MLIILATWEAEIRRIWGSRPTLSKKFMRLPSQPIKAGCDGAHLSSQLQRKHKLEDGGSGCLGMNERPHLKKN
jgi:hypothetical protein